MLRSVQQEVEAVARAYRLRMPERQKLFMAGDLAGRRTGSSIEYQDRKDYVPGDDLRHVDWRAFARTDRLTIKLYREEIAPRVDIVIDTSCSMESTPEKWELAVRLAYFFHILSQQCHAVVQTHELGAQFIPLLHPLDAERSARTRVASPLPLLEAAPAVRRGGLKVVISDFLFPFEPRELRRVFRSADRVVLLQVLSAFEADPQQGGQWRLQEAETGDFLDIGLSRETVEGYLRRLATLQESIEREVRVTAGAFAVARDRDSWDTIARNLLRAGMIEA